MIDETCLNVAKTQKMSMANGPGKRAVIWVQGCTIGCDGCYNSFTHPHKKIRLIEPQKIADSISTIPEIEGVTFSGGEPFEQALAVANTIEKIKIQSPHLTIFIFTGYTLNVLQRSTDANIQRLLGLIDILSAGPYVKKLQNSTLLWRGSENQILHYLSNRYDQSMETEWIKKSPIEEFSIGKNSIFFTGFGGVESEILQTFSSKIRLDLESHS